MYLPSGFCTGGLSPGVAKLGIGDWFVLLVEPNIVDTEYALVG